MTNKIMKLCSVLLCIALLSSAFGLVSFADDTDNTFDFKLLTNTDWNKSYADSVINLPSSLGGKSDLGDDYFALKSVKKYSSSNATRWKYDLTSATKQTYTWEFDALVTAGAVANVGFSTYTNFSMTDSLIKGQMQGVTLENPQVANKPNQWHRVALSYDASLRQMQSYVDGNQVGIVTGFDFENLKYAAFSMDIGLSEVGSMVVYDNAILHNEPYDPSKHLGLAPQISLTADANGIEITGDSLIYDEKIVSDVATVVSLIDAGDSNVSVFKDSTFTELAEGTLLGSECIAVEGANGMYSYYSVKKASLAIYNNEVQFVKDGSKIGAVAKFINTSSEDGLVVMIMVFKDENGVIQKLAASSEVAIPSGTTNPDDAVVEIAPVPSDGFTPEVFFIKGWSGRQRLFDDIYSE